MASDPRFEQLKFTRNTTRERQNEAYEAQERAFKEYVQIRTNNSREIDMLGVKNPACTPLRVAIGEAGARHRAARDAFRAAQSAYTYAKKEFEDYRDELIREREARNAAIAAELGAPADSRVTQDPITGNWNVYYDELGIDPLGPDHAHGVLGPDGKRIYNRLPSEAHGPQNFVGYKPPAKKQAAKPAQRPSAKPADQQAARAREETRRREEARQARERLEAAEREEQHRRDTPWIAAQAAADAARAQAQAETAAQVARQAAEVAVPLHPALRRVHSPLLLAFREKQMQIRVANALAAQPAPVQMPVAPPQPEPVTQEIPAVAGHGPATDHRRPPREPEQRSRPTQSVRPTPPAAPPVQPPAQPTLPAQPAKAGTGQKWEATADRIKREAAERAAAAEGHGPARDFKRRGSQKTPAEQAAWERKQQELQREQNALDVKAGAEGALTAAEEARYIEIKRELRRNPASFGVTQYGSVGGKPVTFALGFDGSEGEKMIADGHKEPFEFRKHEGHNHLGPSGEDFIPEREQFTDPE